MATRWPPAPATRRRRVATPASGVAAPTCALILIMAPAAWLLARRRRPGAGRTGSWSVLWTPLTADRRRAARPDPRHAASSCWACFVVAGTVGRAGRHPPGRVRPDQASERASGRACCAPPRTSCRASPPSCSATSATWPWWSASHWGFSLPARRHHPLHHGGPLHRQDDRERACARCPPATGRGPRPSACPAGYALRKVVLKSALPGIVTGLLLALAIAGGETAPLIYTAGLLQHAAPLADRTHAFPYLTYVVFTFYNHPSVAVPLPRLRRRPDPGGDGAAPAGGQPHHRGAHPAPRRGRPRRTAAPRSSAASATTPPGLATSPGRIEPGLQRCPGSRTETADHLWWRRRHDRTERRNVERRT